MRTANFLYSTFCIALSVGLIAFVAWALLSLFGPAHALSSTGIGEEYVATTTAAAQADSETQAKVNIGGCTVGSIVVASSSATTFELRNATSTTDTASTSIITLKAGIAEGTYTLDAVCDRGLVIVAPTGFTGLYVTTYR